KTHGTILTISQAAKPRRTASCSRGSPTRLYRRERCMPLPGTSELPAPQVQRSDILAETRSCHDWVMDGSSLRPSLSGRRGDMSELDTLPSSPSRGVQAATNFEWDGNRFEAGIGVAASGGGFRAMLFHVGAFIRLAELKLLPRAKRISSVSGGSITTAYLACAWQNLVEANFENLREVFVEPMLAFAREKIDVLDALTGALPWTSAASQLADSYDRHLFAGRTLQDLPDAPQFIFCATNLQTGVLWRFAKAYAGDYVVGRLDKPTLRLALAVAASSAFPPVLSPLVLRPPSGSFGDWPSGGGPLPEAERAAFRERVVLTDGGVYDNHGIEPLIKRFATVL